MVVRGWSVVAAATGFVFASVVLLGTADAAGQAREKAASAAVASAVGGEASGQIVKYQGVWVEGPGFDITYGAPYEACARRCLANARCKMIEYYRPERKCNLYTSVRPRLRGGASIVGMRQAAGASGATK